MTTIKAKTTMIAATAIEEGATAMPRARGRATRRTRAAAIAATTAATTTIS
jgi:hypothetical protein